MKFEKHSLGELDHCYATGYVHDDDRLYYLLAAENDNPCYAFDAETLEKSTVWEHPGGTMSMIEIPNRQGEFLAVQGFRSGFMAQDTSIAWVKHHQEDNTWAVKTILKHPFIHRFDIFSANGKLYFLACTLATTKKDKEDWSDPGKIWVAELPDDLNQPMELSIIQEGLLKNHGYCRVNWQGKMAGMTASENGVLVITPPQDRQDSWHVEKIIDRPISEIGVVDIDGDGVDEIATIEPFHGNIFSINKKTDSGYESIYQYDGDFEFGHVVWGGKLRGKPTFIGGARRGAKELFCVQCVSNDPLEFETYVIESGGGPSNVAVVEGDEQDILIVANRESAEAVLYYVQD